MYIEAAAAMKAAGRTYRTFGSSETKAETSAPKSSRAVMIQEKPCPVETSSVAWVSPFPSRNGNSRFNPLKTPSCANAEYVWTSSRDCHRPIRSGSIHLSTTKPATMLQRLNAVVAALNPKNTP